MDEVSEAIYAYYPVFRSTEELRMRPASDLEAIAHEAEILFKGVRPKEPRISTRSPLKAIRSIFARDEGIQDHLVLFQGAPKLARAGGERRDDLPETLGVQELGHRHGHLIKGAFPQFQEVSCSISQIDAVDHSVHIRAEREESQPGRC